MITRAQLAARLEALKAQRLQTLANYQALNGAVQTVESLIEEFDATKPDPPDPEKD